MGFVFKINEELAAIAVTATELLSITRSTTELIKNPVFIDLFYEIVAEINKSYAVVMDSFSPFSVINSEEDFEKLFDERHAAFKDRFLMDVSKPRRYCDNVYDAYIQMQKTKEAKSSFPMLKRSFSRLDTFYDKWITNDNLLAMSIDGVVKLQNRLLNEIADIKAKDTEDAYFIFTAAFEDFRDFLSLIQVKSDSVYGIVTSTSPAVAVAESG
jgi:hypothetical protein